MAEALGVASAILAIIEFAFTTSTTLYEQISSLKSHVETVNNLQSDLGALATLLKTLQVQLAAESTTGDGVTHDNHRLDPIKRPLLEVGRACETLGAMLKGCAVETTSKREIVRKWLKMQYNGKSIDETRSLVASYKSTLAIALELVNLHDREQSQRNLEELQERIDGLKDSLDLKIDEVKDALEDSNAERHVQLETDHKALSDALLFCNQALLAAQQTKPLPDMTLNDNEATDNSHLYVGANAYDGTYNFSASRNKAATGSLGAFGIYNPDSIKAMSEAAPTATSRMLKVALQTTSDIHYGVGSNSVSAMTWNSLQSVADDENLQADFPSLPKSRIHDSS
ncbi:hypothetical protein KCU93_g7877, partial [Aureobasidium melanogenum]